MKYFTIEELTKSATAERLGIDNTPTVEAVKNLTHLIERLLDPVRQRYGAPIYVNSGYRCNELNRAVGGAYRSYHLLGRAADLTTGSRSGNARLYKLLADMPHEELINEQNYRWIHVAI
ncbi:MAG: peptidase M15 [Muribaculaceae bacterium]|nr:peptidase M15 [Muribaculaceae bacterium]